MPTATSLTTAIRELAGTRSNDALTRHAFLVDRIIEASGLYDFERLYRELRELASAPRPSESVRFSSVRRVPPVAAPWVARPFSEGTSETIDLGWLKQWSQHPGKTYPARRHFTSGGKVVTLYLGRRSVRSKVRLGYKLRIDQEIVDITTWATQPAPEAAVDWFPTTPIERELRLRKKVYDCVQSRNLTAVEEESFDESGDPSGAQRLLLNERTAEVTVKVRIEFVAIPNQGDPNPYLGEAKVYLESSDPKAQSAAIVLDVDVLETHLAFVDPPTTEEVVVEGLNLHIVPSYLIVGSEFFEDYWGAFTRMLQAKVAAVYAASKHRMDLQDLPTEVDPSPKSLTVSIAKEIELSKHLFTEFERHPELKVELGRHRLSVPGI